MHGEAVERRETSAGGVVYRQTGETGGGIEVALAVQVDRLTGERTRRLPKGKPEGDETPEQTALREVSEETGLTAKVVESLGCVDYVYREEGGDVAKQVHFFLMEWLEGVPAPRDGEMEQVYWCPMERAAGELTFETERVALARARQRLEAVLEAAGPERA